MVNLSSEQLEIINSNKNLMVFGNAGVGKTSTILNIALTYSNLNIIQITYNTMLKNEVIEKVKKLNIKNLYIYSYHSLCYNLYDNSDFTDEHIKKILLNDIPLKEQFKMRLDILIIDETQDQTFDYYKLVKKFLKDINQDNVRIILFGDIKQCIYGFKNASSKFLSLAPQIWNKNFEIKKLTTSFRLTNQVSFFINMCMYKKHALDPTLINTIKDNDKVKYYITNPYKIATKLGNEIIKFLKNGYKEEDIFILVPSVKINNAPFKKLENWLVKKKLKCFTPTNDNMVLSNEIINEKIVITTFHQSKGRERKIVIIFNFDMSFFTFFDRQNNINNCPNVLYVACSRAIDKLILIQDEKNEKLPFLNLHHPDIKKYVDVIQTNKTIIPQKLNIENNFIKKSVSDFVKFLSSETTNQILLKINTLFEIVYPENKNVKQIVNKIETHPNIYEDVSDLNGLAIPSIYEKLITNNISTIEFYVLSQLKKYPDIKKYINDNVVIPCITIPDYLKVCNIYNAIQNQLHSKLAQIQNYNWLTTDNLNTCMINLTKIPSNNLIFEYKITNNDESEEDFFTYTHDEHGVFKISARVDAFDENNIYEFKCTSMITIEHKLQLLMYYWLWHHSKLSNNYGKKNGIIMNIQTGLTLQLIPNDYVINEIFELIILDKINNMEEETDEIFLNKIYNN
jgi:hypothetical protein